MCLGLFFLGSNLFGTLWASRTSWKSISFARLGKFSFIMFSSKFSISCFSPSPSGTPMIHMSEYLKFSKRLLSLSSFFWIVSSLWSSWMFISSFCSTSLIGVLVSFPSLLVPCIFLFYFLTSPFILQLYTVISVSILITSVLNSASDRLTISSSLSSFSGVLICSYIWALFLCLSAPVTL